MPRKMNESIIPSCIIVQFIFSFSRSVVPYCITLLRLSNLIALCAILLERSMVLLRGGGEFRQDEGMPKGI